MLLLPQLLHSPFFLPMQHWSIWPNNSISDYRMGPICNLQSDFLDCLWNDGFFLTEWIGWWCAHLWFMLILSIKWTKTHSSLGHRMVQRLNNPMVFIFTCNGWRWRHQVFTDLTKDEPELWNVIITILSFVLDGFLFFLSLIILEFSK